MGVWTEDRFRKEASRSECVWVSSFGNSFTSWKRTHDCPRFWNFFIFIFFGFWFTGNPSGELDYQLLLHLYPCWLSTLPSMYTATYFTQPCALLIHFLPSDDGSAHAGSASPSSFIVPIQ